MPDLESFIVSAKNQEDLKSGIQRKKKKKPVEENDDGEEPENELSALKNAGTKSRPVNGNNGTISNQMSSTM